MSGRRQKTSFPPPELPALPRLQLGPEASDLQHLSQSSGTLDPRAAVGSGPYRCHAPGAACPAEAGTGR